MKNQLIDLNNHLFAALERVNDEDKSQEQLAQEIERAKAVCTIAKEITNNARLALDAQIAVQEYKGLSIPMLESKS